MHADLQNVYRVDYFCGFYSAPFFAPVLQIGLLWWVLFYAVFYTQTVNLQKFTDLTTFWGSARVALRSRSKSIRSAQLPLI
jgi:hypothetical protein